MSVTLAQAFQSFWGRILTGFAIVATMLCTMLALEQYMASADRNIGDLENRLVDPVLMYKDETKSIDFAEAYELHSSRAFLAATETSGLASLQDASLWFYASFTSEKTKSVELFFDTDLRVVPSGEIYSVRNGQVALEYAEDDTSFASARPVSPRRFAIPVQVDAGETVEFFFRYDPKVYHKPVLRLIPLQALMEIELNERSQHLVLFGICTALAIAGLAICFALRFTPAAIYSGFVLSLMSYSFVTTGYAFEYLPGWHNGVHDYAIILVICAACSTGAIFVNGIFEFRKVAPFFHGLIWFWVGLSGLSAVAALLPVNPQFEVIAYLFLAFSGQVYFILGCFSIFFGWGYSRLLLFGSSMQCVIGSSAFLMPFGLAWASSGTLVTAYRLSVLIEAFAFLLMIVLRISEIRRTEEAASSRSLELMKTEIELNKALRSAEKLALQKQAEVDEKVLQAEAQIEDLKNDLERTGRVNLMGQFASGLAHELNQPLGALVHDVDTAKQVIAENDTTPSELKNILSSIESHTFRAGEIIRALRSMVGQRKQSKISFDIRNLAEQTIAIVKKEADANEVGLLVDIEQDMRVFADRAQIAQVLVNLLRNAIEALGTHDTCDKQVLISATTDKHRVLLIIQDNGPGIPSNLSPFSEFESGSTNGMGLGLSICRSLVLANNGQIAFDEMNSRGAKFKIDLVASR